MTDSPELSALAGRLGYVLDAPTGPLFAQRKASLTRHDLRRCLAALSSAPVAGERRALKFALNHLNADTFTGDAIEQFHEMATNALSHASPVDEGMDRSETLEQFAERVTREVRKGFIGDGDDEMIAGIRESHMVFAKASVIQAISHAMLAASTPKDTGERG